MEVSIEDSLHLTHIRRQHFSDGLEFESQFDRQGALSDEKAFDHEQTSVFIVGMCEIRKEIPLIGGESGIICSEKIQGGQLKRERRSRVLCSLEDVSYK